MTTWLKQAAFFVWSTTLFICGMLFYSKVLDKPETTVNNDIGKIKNKGENNDISTSSNTLVNQDNKREKNKRKFILFKK